MTLHRTPPSFKLQKILTKADFRAAFPVLRQLAEIELPKQNVTLDGAWSQYRKALKQDYTLYMAVSNAEILAVAGVRVLYDPLSDAPYISINNLVVEEDFRGIGIGTAMLRQIRQAALKKKYSGSVINVLKTNKRAKRLYESLGFGKAVAEIMYEDL